MKVVRTPRDRVDGPFPWGQFETHQVAWLRAYAGAGALSLAAIYDAPERLLTMYVLRPDDIVVGRSCAHMLSTHMHGSMSVDFTGWPSVLSLWERFGQRLGH